MTDRLFREREADVPTKRSFAHRLVPWESSRWHVGIFLAEGQDGTAVVGVGLVHRGKKTATYERNVDVEDVTAINAPIPLARVQHRLGGFADAVAHDGPVTEARGRRLLDALIAESPALQPVIARLLRRIDDEVTAGVAGELQGLQKDATGVLLKARGMDRSELRRYEPQPAGTPFIAGLSGASMIEPGPTTDLDPGTQFHDGEELSDPGDVQERWIGRVTEDQLIIHDADRVPYRDWFQVHDQRVGWRTFTDGAKKMEIASAISPDSCPRYWWARTNEVCRPRASARASSMPMGR